MGSAVAVRGEASTGTGLGRAWAGTAPPARVAAVVVTAVAAAGILVHRTATTGSPATAGALIAVDVIAGAAAVVDRHECRLPNRLVSAAAIATLVGALASSTPAISIAHLLVGAAGAGLPLLFVLLHRGIGMGDVKLGAVLGAAAALVHPLAAPTALAVGAFAAGTTGLLTGRQRLAVGPFLWAGWAVTLVAFALTARVATVAP